MTNRVSAVFDKEEKKLILKDSTQGGIPENSMKDKNESSQNPQREANLKEEGQIEEDQAPQPFLEVIDEEDIQSYLHMKIEESLGCLLSGESFSSLYLLKFAEIVLEVIFHFFLIVFWSFFLFFLKKPELFEAC